MLTGAGGAQGDIHLRHEAVARVVLIPETDDAGLIRADVNIAADIPPVALHVLVIARAAGHLPPAVPVAVPPVQQRVAGLFRRCVSALFLVEGVDLVAPEIVEHDAAVL